MLQTNLSEFADKMNEIVPVIMKEFARRQANELYKGKITLPQFLILNFLHRNGVSKMTNLARFMDVSTPAMTGIVERLVREGYCERAYNPKDRRIINVKLTAKGNEVVRKINKQRRNMVIRIFGKISQLERSEYLRILMRIQEILAREKQAQ